MSFHDAAMKILQEERRPLSPEEITQKALQKGLINTKGKTPSATMGEVDTICIAVFDVFEKSS